MSNSNPINRITDRIVERLEKEGGSLTTTELLLVGIYSELAVAREHREKKDQATSVDMGPATPPTRRPGRPRKSAGE